MIFLYFGIEALFVIQSYHVNTFPADEDPNRNIEIIMTYTGNMGHAVASILLLTPSLAFTVIYQIISLGAMFLQAYLTDDLNGPIWRYILAVVVFPVCFFGTLMFYIHQSRELKRFYQQQKATLQQ